MGHKVKCRACGEIFDRDLLIRDKDWVMPSTNHYYHKSCFDQWANKKETLEARLSNEEWFEALKYYLNHVIKAPVDWKKLTSQWNHYLKQNKTAKGIYFAMRYFYDVVHGDKEKSQGGIGIISLIYQDSCYYWENRFRRDSTIIEKIEEQARQQIMQKVNLVKQNRKTTNKKKPISLEDI